MQIDFGTYHYGERLPSIEDAGRLFFVSIEPVRSAYMRLKQEGYITLSPKNGAIIKVRYSDQDIQQNIQNFFAPRREALLDLSCSMKPLFSQLQWTGLKNATPERLDEIDAMASRKDLLTFHIMISNLQQIYSLLNNNLLMRLVWQVFMFFQAPFVSIDSNVKNLTEEDNPLLNMTRLCREKNWTALRIAIENFQSQLAAALHRFYESRITAPYSGPQVEFQWSSYKKASQICYSLGMEILIGINRGVYPAGTFLPSLQEMAKEKNVSVITVRRTLALLGSIGVTKSINGLGTRILKPEEISENCDLAAPSVRRCLLNSAQSLQIIALTCRDVSEVTFAANNSAVFDQFRDRLVLLRTVDRCPLASFGIIELLTHLAPSHTIRTIYHELFLQLMWSYPLHREEDPLRDYHPAILKYFLECLNKEDVGGLSAKLEEVLLIELGFVTGQMRELGIISAEPVLHNLQ